MITMSRKTVDNFEREELTALIDELRTIRGVKRGEIADLAAEQLFAIGTAVLSSSLYKKHAKGSGELVSLLAAEAEISESYLYFAVECAGRWTLEEARGEFQRGDGVLYISDIKKALPSGKDSSPLSEEAKCRHCPLKGHCPPRVS